MILLQFLGAGMVLTVCVIVAFVFGVGYGYGIARHNAEQQTGQDFTVHIDADSPEEAQQQVLAMLRKSGIN